VGTDNIFDMDTRSVTYYIKETVFRVGLYALFSNKEDWEEIQEKVWEVWKPTRQQQWGQL
jgi:hypothetical protein